MKKILLFLLILLVPLNVFAYSNYIIPGGENVGIEIKSKGVLVIGFYKVNGKLNQNGLNIGDYIIKVNNREVNSIDELVKNIENERIDNKVNITILRNNKEKNIDFKLIEDKDSYKTGLYVKDSVKGIGTLTYVDPETKIFGALGHEIIDNNTKSIIEIKTGSIFNSKITGIDRSINGNPGTKNAKLYENEKIGLIDKNTNKGIFGIYKEDIKKDLVEVADESDLKEGKATIYTVLDGSSINEYEINITKIDLKSNIKNIYFEITDNNLLSRTGGIIQGMSGSPIIQNGKIVGAVTHVLTENVTKGYGIYIKKMLEIGEN